MQLGSILSQEVLVKRLDSQGGLIIVGTFTVDVLAQKGGFSCLTVADQSDFCLAKLFM